MIETHQFVRDLSPMNTSFPERKRKQKRDGLGEFENELKQNDALLVFFHLMGKIAQMSDFQDKLTTFGGIFVTDKLLFYKI